MVKEIGKENLLKALRDTQIIPLVLFWRFSVILKSKKYKD